MESNREGSPLVSEKIAPVVQQQAVIMDHGLEGTAVSLQQQKICGSASLMKGIELMFLSILTMVASSMHMLIFL